MKKEIIKRITLAGICICAVLSQTMGAEAHDVYTVTGGYLTVVEPRTEEEVRELLQRAEAGEAEAQHELAICYGRGNGVPQDYTEAFKWAMASAKQGYAPAEDTVGSCYQAGKGVEQNIEEAIKWIQRAADKGDMSACWNRGLFYLTGAYGAEQNFEKAAIYIRQAADAGYVQACRIMGLMHVRGNGVPRDVELGRQWLEKAAAQSDAESEMWLSRMAVEVGNKEEAISWLKSAAEHGHGEAAARLGELYRTGEGEAVPQDLAQARLWYERGVELGNAQAQNDLGYMLLMGIGGETDTEHAKELFEAAIAQGYIRAAANLGVMYFEGKGVPQDKQKAVEITKPAANAGDSLAQRNMGIEACNTGDYAQGREWFLKAAEQGDSGGMLYLGELYLKGLGGTRDLQKARKYLEAAAAQSDAESEVLLARVAASLGELYLTGEAVPQDLAQARLWYERGVELGNAQAQNGLGYMLLMGIGGETDTEHAKELFEAAIAQGYIRAATNLGLMYFEGKGVPQDKQKAVEITKPAANAGDSLAQRHMGIEACNTGDYAQGREWFLKAAEQGDPGGMLGLGKLYLEGRGGARDLQKARKYLEAAAASGEEVPEEILKELRSIHTE